MAATISTRPKPKSQLAGGGQVSLRSPPHLTTTPATAGEEALTSGREESGSGEELHHSIKEWQAAGGQAALQEQPPDSRSPLHGMTAPGVNLHKEPEEKVEESEEAEDNVQSVSSKVAAREKVQEEFVQLNQEHEHDEEQNVSKEKHDEAEKGKTLEELGEKEEEEVDPDDVGIQAKSEQGGSLQNQSGHDGDPPGQDGDPPVQPDQDLHLHHPELKELEEHVAETEKEEIEEVKVIEEQLLNTDTKAEKTENVEERPHEHGPDHLSGSVDLVGEVSGLELHQNKKEISFTPALDASQASQNPEVANELLIGDSPSRSPGNYAENGVGESKAAVSQTYPDEVGRDEEGGVDGEEAFEKENISEELFGASESHENSGELKKNPVVENPDKTVVTEWEWGRDVNEVEAPVAPLVDGNKKEQGEKVDLKDSPVGKEDPLVTLMEVEEHSMQLLLTPKSWQPQASVSRCS